MAWGTLAAITWLAAGCAPTAARFPAEHPASASSASGPVGDPGAGTERPSGPPPVPETPARVEHGAPMPPERAAPAAPHHDPAHMAKMAALRDRLRAKLGAAYEDEVPGLERASAERGAVTFRRLCVPCHGAGGKGDGPAAAGLQPPPADLTDPEHARFYTDAGRVEVIRSGSPGTAMAGFGAQLSEQELLDVYAYVRTLRGDGPPTPGREGHHGH